MNHPVNPEPLLDQYRRWRSDNPKARFIDGARALRVPEAALVDGALRPLGHAKPLRRSWPAILDALQTLGPVMALTRNATTVHEKIGAYPKLMHEGVHALFLSEDIDLRLFLGRWGSGFAVDVHTPRGVRPSLQFFDTEGTAVHKIYAVEGTDEAAWDALVLTYADEDVPAPKFTPIPTPEIRPDEAVDTRLLADRWRGLQDTHDFFPMLRSLKLERQQALRLAPHDLACTLPEDTVPTLLESAAETGLDIMVFVGNPGCIQIHTGPVHTVKWVGHWINVLDPGFNLHLRMNQVASTWRVVKPTVDGPVHSIELFDHEGGLMAQFFGRRKPGTPEDERWRALVSALATR